MANELEAVLLTISVPSSEIMQASTSERWAWPPNVPTDETPLCRSLGATAQDVRTDPGSACSDGDGQNSSATIRRSRLFGLYVTLCSRNG